MTTGKDREYIWPVISTQGTDPKQGLFSVKLHKGCEPRALSVMCNQGMWIVHLDGKPVATPHMNWHMAFGWIFSRAIPDDITSEDLMPLLIGVRIGFEKYKILIAQRTADERNGYDLSKPLLPQQLGEDDGHEHPQSIDWLRVAIP